ncbi:MAG: hypothetical protein J6B43_07030 [Lachnospiraceae bacterium]|nr:hypothetical protein [Lachnospiraceae bacterium]
MLAHIGHFNKLYLKKHCFFAFFCELCCFFILIYGYFLCCKSVSAFIFVPFYRPHGFTVPIKTKNNFALCKALEAGKLSMLKSDKTEPIAL